MNIRPFNAWRPVENIAEKVASVPYDVIDTSGARTLAEGNPLSFLHVIRAEIDLPDHTDPYSEAVYAKARENLETFKSNGTLIHESEPCIYLYSQQMGEHTQYGIVADCHIDDYLEGRIKIHEKTRAAKEADRIHYVDAQNANTGPVFLAYRENESIDAIVNATRETTPLYDFTARDGVRHTVWKIEDTQTVVTAFDRVPEMYVADGHHRSASAAKVGQMRREANPNHTGQENYNYFLAVLFPANQLHILAYNRVILKLEGLSEADYMEKVNEKFTISPDGKASPAKAGEICMYMNGQWSTLTPRQTPDAGDPVAALDVSILQNELLGPILGIDDPRESDNIDFIGGIKGTVELEKQVDSGRAVIAFSMFPTSMEQLFAVADANRLMPPKSTWFEPKLRSGLLINCLD